MSRNEHNPRTAMRAILATLFLAALASAANAHTSARQDRTKTEKHRSAGSPLCQVSNITIEMPKEFLPLRVINNSYIARENSVAVLTLNSGFPKPIQEIALVIEYLDPQGKRIFATTFAATANPVISPMWFSENLPSQYSIVPWKTAVASGVNFSIGATSGLTSGACPAQARATLLHVAFPNGTNLDWSAPNWELPVQPEAIPGNFQIDVPPPSSLPAEFLVRVHVPAPDGALIPSPQIRLLSGQSSPFFDEMRDQMLTWRYWFELRGGKPVDGDVLLLIRVHAAERLGDNLSRLPPADASKTLGVVDVVPQKAFGQWAVFYGGANLVNNSPAQTEQ
ncbi:MAG: hypothetical protein WBD73_03760 [Candidatus Acidiferrales bacterium]